VLSVLNPSPVPASGAQLEAFCAQLSQIDFLVVNEPEAEHLTDHSISVVDAASGLKCAELLVTRGAKCVVVTLGAQGAVAFPGNIIVKSPAPEKVVDTTGAGDSFLGAMVYYLWKGEPLEKAMTEACKVAAKSVEREGCQKSYVKSI
jgi:sugar/nucleoside kinase (ribokinase family)